MPKAPTSALPPRRRKDPERKTTEPAPGAFVIDDEAGICRYLATALGQLGLAAESFHTADAAIAAFERAKPDIVFLDNDLGGTDAIDVIRVLGEKRYAGIVQLMSGAKSALLDDVHRIGALRGLNMCQPLQKPFRSDAIKEAIASIPLWDQPEITISLAPAIEPRLEDMIANNALELWYQPQIDLRTRAIAGMEAVIVMRHPVRGAAPIDGLLQQASPATRASLAERFVAQALDDWSDLARAGLNSRIAIAASFDALANGNLVEVARQRRPRTDRWPGLILEISEHEVIQDINLAHEIATQLRIHDITLGIDNFGAGYSSFERLRELPFSELKLHPGFVAGCATDDKNAGICRAAIDLAHRFGILAVAAGLESEADLCAVEDFGCDIGQGPLFAEPMPKSEFVNVFGERARTKHAWTG
jgi:EAL domain-containing protein (putative c-di-GMP-specific phosphodiesterase class I)/ActR/RegA family two-component response regulator